MKTLIVVEVRRNHGARELVVRPKNGGEPLVKSLHDYFFNRPSQVSSIDKIEDGLLIRLNDGSELSVDLLADELDFIAGMMRQDIKIELFSTQAEQGFFVVNA
jgi:hypothetical protein